MRSTRCVFCFSLALALLCLSALSQGQAIIVSFAPPALPVYEQPLLPGEGYIWTPGYWAWDNEFDGYYWVPGTWVLPPQPGLFWTPPYWGWGGNGYAFYPGYWAPQVGYYGGINYGYGYFGRGYEGGRWDHDRWYYNRAVNNLGGENVHNVYITEVNERNVSRVSYNGGQGGIEARPTAAEERVMHDRHVGPVQAQNQQVQTARGDQQLRASVNQGRPPIAATPKPGEFKEHGVVPAKEAGAPYHPPANRTATAANAATPSYPMHAKDVPPHTMPPPNTGNAKQDQKYLKQQQKLEAQQQKEHQQLAQQQEQEHQREAQQQQREQQQHARQQQREAQQQQHAQQQQQQREAQQQQQLREQQQQAAQARNQEMERMHQQQTQQMEERHAQQQQQMQERQQPGGHPPAPHAGATAQPEKH